MKPKLFYQCFLLFMSSFSSVFADSKIYHWQSPSEETVFSNPPSSKQNSKTTTLNIKQLNVISLPQHTNNNKTTTHKDTLDSIDNSLDTDTAPKSLKTITILSIKIISPGNNTHIHNFYPLIPIKTIPTLSAKASVRVIANGKTTNGVYQNDTWNIPRPPPGKNEISLYGTTDQEEAFSSDTIILYVHNSHIKKLH